MYRLRQKLQSGRHYAVLGGVCLSVAVAALCVSDGVQAATQITMTGSVAQNCTINVTADPNASALNLTATGTQRIQVGTVLQNCNKRAGYSIAVTSTNCAAAPTGAKLVGTVSGDTLAYAVESDNPTTGGSSATVTGLLASACTGQNARAVSNAKISAENSTVFISYTGSTSLSADSYQDTLTFTMNVN